MRRENSLPRAGWQKRCEEAGFGFHSMGGTYWNESACYAFAADQIDRVEEVTAELHRMCVEAAAEVVKQRRFAEFAIPENYHDYVAESFRRGEPTLYGRFDLAWDGTGEPRLLEYNADTPAGLVEAAVCQWTWLEETHPDRDQWNMLHEHLVKRWGDLRSQGIDVVHFAVGQQEPTEDWVTVAYLRDTAQEAGVQTLGVTVEDIGWHHDREVFLDPEDVEMRYCFAMYPTEWMLDSIFGQHLIAGRGTTRWIEPPWKLLLGSKALLPVLWDMFPGHPNLLPSYFDAPYAMRRYVTKPLFGWEGDGVEIHGEAIAESVPRSHTEGQQVVYQQYVDLPDFDGNRPVLGTWVIGGRAAGLGIRESRERITTTRARFVPHLMDTPRSSPDQVASWLADTDHR